MMSLPNIEKKIILVAHGEGMPGSHSNKKVCTITKAHEKLSFETAIEYMKSSKTAAEYPSVSFGKFVGLTDKDCKELFDGKTGLASSGFVFTGLRKGRDTNGMKIYALRVIAPIGLTEIVDFADQEGYEKVILLACRN